MAFRQIPYMESTTLWDRQQEIRRQMDRFAQASPQPNTAEPTEAWKARRPFKRKPSVHDRYRQLMQMQRQVSYDNQLLDRQFDRFANETHRY